VNQRIQEIRTRFESLEKTYGKPASEATANTFARIINEKIQDEPDATSDISSLENMVEQKADAVGLDPDLAKAVVKAESGFNPKAVSPKGAIGLMQLMPETARTLGVNPHDPAQNVEAGACYLRDLLVRYDNLLWHALAAYNAGTQAVDRHRGIPPYAETLGYINRITLDYQKKSPAPPLPTAR
jgi:soluble lytic murein transglycosylase-like protein